MSARQAFVPRPPSRESSELHPLPTDACASDGNKDMFVNGNGKARSMSALFGQRRGTGVEVSPQGARPTQGTGLGRANTSTNRQTFEGILRPPPMSTLLCPTMQFSSGLKQPRIGQTPVKTAGPGALEFQRPMTPVSVPRNHKKGLENYAKSPDVRLGAASGMGGYMRLYDESGDDRTHGSTGGLQSSLDPNVVAPVPGYAPVRLGENQGGGQSGADGRFVHSSRHLGAMADTETGTDNIIVDTQRSLVGTKRGTGREDIEESGSHADGGHQSHRSAKRMRHMQHDEDEYLPISSPHVPPTPRLPAPSVDMVDPLLVVGSLLEDVGEFFSPGEVETSWKRWKECATEEWLNGTEELAKDYADLLNMVKDHMTTKVMAYASMISSVEEKRANVRRDIEIIHRKGNIVRENISKLGMK